MPLERTLSVVLQLPISPGVLAPSGQLLGPFIPKLTLLLLATPVATARGGRNVGLFISVRYIVCTTLVRGMRPLAVTLRATGHKGIKGIYSIYARLGVGSGMLMI